MLLRPVAANDRFGLGPLFRIEPLGMECIAAGLSAAGHDVALADLRFSEDVDRLMRRHRPGLVGIAAMRALQTDDVVELAARRDTSWPHGDRRCWCKVASIWWPSRRYVARND